jgi:hypothetical protein
MSEGPPEGGATNSEQRGIMNSGKGSGKMSERLIEWLSNWKRNLLEVFVAAGILASAFTTFTGAYQLVNRSVGVAALFTAFFQGGMYVVGHYTHVSELERKRRRTFTLCFVWCIFAFFSVYASALGMFNIQQESLRSDGARRNVFKQWNDAARALAEFRTRALAEINQAKQAANLEINLERGRIRVARTQHRPYPTEGLQKLNSELATIQYGETRFRDVRPLAITAPENSDEARRGLDEAFASAGDAHAALPERIRSRVSLPHPNEQSELPENIQKAFWEELKSRSVPVILIVVFATALDLLPPLVLFATAPKPTAPERVLRFRQAWQELRASIYGPLAGYVESVKVTVREAPELDIRMRVATYRGGPLLDIDADFADVTIEVGRETGRDMALASVKTGLGRPLVDGLPLLAQLGEEREVVLSYAPRSEDDFDAYSAEVN